MSPTDLLVILTSKKEAQDFKESLLRSKIEGAYWLEVPGVFPFRIPEGTICVVDSTPITESWASLDWKEIVVERIKSPITVFSGTPLQEYDYLWKINLELSAWSEDLKGEVKRLHELWKQISEQQALYSKAIQCLKEPV